MAVDISTRTKKIWIVTNRLDLQDNNLENQTPTAITISENTTTDHTQDVFREALGLEDAYLVLKLRNSRGSIIPINSFIQPNSKLVPYVVEVVERYQHVKPLPRTVKMSTYNETLKNKLHHIVKRIEKLEELAPELRNRRNDKIKKEMEELDEKMNFLNRRMQQAESQKWKGMFKKHPLW